jgi:hypothetical protein
MAIRKNRNGDFITSEDVSKMKYTNKVSLSLSLSLYIYIYIYETIEINY